MTGHESPRDSHHTNSKGAPATNGGYGVKCPLCHRRVVTTEAPCECGFRFPRGYGEAAPGAPQGFGADADPPYGHDCGPDCHCFDPDGHVCQPEQTDSDRVTCPGCGRVYVLDPMATADEGSYSDGD